MTLIAQLDTTKTPPVAIALYNFTNAAMVPPAYINVTNVHPTPLPGSTYNAQTGVWTYPKQPENMLGWAQSAIVQNNAFGAIKNPSGADIGNQLQALTWQVTRVLNRRIGGV